MPREFADRLQCQGVGSFGEVDQADLHAVDRVAVIANQMHLTEERSSGLGQQAFQPDARTLEVPVATVTIVHHASLRKGRVMGCILAPGEWLKTSAEI